MSQKFALAVLAGTLLTSIVQAEDLEDNWIHITESSDFLFQGKSGSGRMSDLDGKKNSGYVYVYQKKNKNRNTYEYGQIVIKLETCRKGYGYIYYNDMDGKYKDRMAFVRFGNTVADGLGTLGCSSWDGYTGKVSGQDKGDTWEVAAESAKTDTKYFIKTDTIRKRSYNGKPGIAALYSDSSVTENRTTYSEYVIATSDCARGFGIIYELDFDGALMSKNDVALNGNSIISAIANRLCKNS